MACSVNISSYALSNCFSSRGGVKAAWLAVYVPSAYTITSADTVSGFASGITWYKQELRHNTGSLTSTLNANDDNGTSYVTTEAVIVYSKMDKENRMNAAALTKGDFLCIIEDANGAFYALGEEEPVKALSGTGETGTARDDANRYQISVTDYNSTFPKMLDSAAIALLP